MQFLMLLVFFLLFNSLLGPGFFMFIMNTLLQSLPSPSFSRCLMMRVTPRGVSRPPCLGEPRGPQDRVQQRTVEQLAEVVPMVQILDIPEPQPVEQLVDVLRLVDALVPVAEQVIEVPKIILENIPPRRLVRDPQLAEQLVAVPTPFPAHVPVPHMEDQLVDVPQTHIVPRSFFVGTDRNIWCQLRGPSGVYWWRCGTTHTQWTSPPGYTARPGRDTNTGRRDGG